MSFLRKLLFIPPAAVGVALVYFAVSSRDAPPTASVEEVSTPVRYVTVAPRGFTPRVKGFGSVEPARTWSAVAQVSGRVQYVNPSFVGGGAVRAVHPPIIIFLGEGVFGLSVLGCGHDIGVIRV